MTVTRRGVLGGMTGGAIVWGTGAAGGVPVAGFGRPVEVLGDAASREAEATFGQLFEVAASADAGAVFTLGVASGDPRPQGVVLWTRVEPSAVPTAGGRVTVAYEIATRESFAGTVILSGVAPTSADRDWTIKLPVESVRLRPFTEHFYRFIVNNVASPVGRFKTLPLADQSVSRVRLAFCSCQDFGNGYYTAFANLAREPLDYVIHLGDYIYEEAGDPAFQGNQVRPVPPLPSGSPVAASLDDYRHLYRTYRSDPDLQEAHRRFAFIQVWDDHEFANDCWGVTRPDDTASGEPEAQPSLRAAANRAWTEYVPAEVPEPSGASLQIYRSLKLGRLAELFATDERLYRSGPPCGNETAGRYATAGCPALNNASRTMLGAEQRAWFVDGVTGSTATWQLWANEVMVMPLRLLNTFGRRDILVNLDAWDGFPAERQAILGELFNNGVRNLIAVTGDIHSFGAGYLKRTYNGAEGALPTFGAVGVEFVGGSITSANLVELLQGAAAGAGLPIPAEAVPQMRAAVGARGGIDIATLLVTQNPHLRYFSSSSHGYGVLELTPTRATCQLKAVATVRERTSTVRTLRTFRVPVNRPVLLT